MDRWTTGIDRVESDVGLLHRSLHFQHRPTPAIYPTLLRLRRRGFTSLRGPVLSRGQILYQTTEVIVAVGNDNDHAAVALGGFLVQIFGGCDYRVVKSGRHRLGRSRNRYQSRGGDLGRSQW